MLYSPTRYTGQFATIAQLGETFRLTCWQFGKATGHKEFRTIAEAVAVAIGLGLVEAGEKVRAMFEQDVLMAI